jgi:hypothetical protein
MTTILNDGGAVTTEAELSATIVQAASETAGGAYEIDLGNNITLTSALEAINVAAGVTVEIVGNGYTLDGGGAQRGLFVYAGSVTVSDLALNDMKALGGNGVGGGAGLCNGWPGSFRLPAIRRHSGRSSLMCLAPSRIASGNAGRFRRTTSNDAAWVPRDQFIGRIDGGSGEHLKQQSEGAGT